MNFSYKILVGEKYKYQLTGDACCLVKIGKQLDTPFIRIKSGVLLVKELYAWDGPSGPTIGTPSFMRGSLFHDALYQLIREGHLASSWRKYADQLLREICLEDGMNRFRAWYVYRSVRMFGWLCVRRKG